MKMTCSQFKNIRRWIYRNARPLDISRWQFHFENGTKENILAFLSAYQNEDGGFAHALEADSWNPHSSPIQTWCAVELLREIGVEEKTSPVIQGILHYLDSGDSFLNNKWAFGIESNNNYPHARWWGWKPETISDYNPTASLAGFTIKYAEKNSQLYTKAGLIAKQAADSFYEREEINEGHLLLCFIRLYQFCIESNTTNLFDMDLYADKLSAHVSTYLKNIQLDWSCDGVAFECIKAYKDNLQLILNGNNQVEDIAKYLLNNLQPDGFWDIPWSWNAYNDEWAVSKNWWKAYGIISNMLFLKQYNYLPDTVKVR